MERYLSAGWNGIDRANGRGFGSPVKNVISMTCDNVQFVFIDYGGDIKSVNKLTLIHVTTKSVYY